MAKSLCYADAVLLLGGRDDRVMAAWNRIAGGLVATASAVGGGGLLGLFDAKGELTRLGDRLIVGLRDQLHGLGRFSRSERMLAANTVIVLTAYFDTLAELGPPEIRLSAAEQVAVSTGGAPVDPQLRRLAEKLLRSEVPVLAPQRPYEDTLVALKEFYQGLSVAVLDFLTGLAEWEALDETRRGRYESALRDVVPAGAVTGYNEGFRRLAQQCPEVAFWAAGIEHQATRYRLDQLGSGLAGIERVLSQLVTARAPDDRRQALSRLYRAALDRPVLDSEDAGGAVRIPPLSDAYIDPSYRVAEINPSDQLSEDSWWNHPVRSDLTSFLLGYLTTPASTSAPLVILGQPGSGKSLLTKVLAARLPAADYLVVRVPLRDVPADVDVQTQIEHAVRAASGETLSWPDLARTADGALPVLLLDGFDELLQATGVTQSDYFQKVASFQRREADQGRPVAVLVTSRTAVADRARPVHGMVALRLEQFTPAQVERWVEIWNRSNAAPSFQPLPAAAVLRHLDLAVQPLLLLMLALYDADGHQLQRTDDTLRESELYERLLQQFAGREVLKAGAGLPDDRLAREAESELLQLSMTAFATFNRRRQWVTDAELDEDLSVLLPGPPRAAVTGHRAELTSAQRTVGRFFFVHQTQALRDDSRLHTYEFLHASFAEYLLARTVSRELRDLTNEATRASDRSRPAGTDDGFLHALLSFAPLCLRAPTVTFLGELLDSSAWKPARTAARELVLALFREALQPRPVSLYDTYRPAALDVPARHASYSANLLLLAVLLGGQVTASELFGAESVDLKGEWHRMALLWRSQSPPEGFTALVNTLDIHREWAGAARELRITMAGADQVLTIDPYWTYDHSPESEEKRGDGTGESWHGWYLRDVTMLRRQERFLCGHDEDVLLHAVEPLITRLPEALSGFGGYWPDRAVSTANALLELLLLPAEVEPAELLAAYNTCLLVDAIAYGPEPENTKNRLDQIVLRQLLQDLPRLPLDSVISTLRERVRASSHYTAELDDFLQLVDQILPTPLARAVRDEARPVEPVRTSRRWLESNAES